MIHISLAKEGINILDRQKIYTSFSFVLPMALRICRIVRPLSKEYNLTYNIRIRIYNTIDLEVKNER